MPSAPVGRDLREDVACCLGQAEASGGTDASLVDKEFQEIISRMIRQHYRMNFEAIRTMEELPKAGVGPASRVKSG